MPEKVSQRKAYGQTLARLGATHPEMVVLDADISKSTCTYYFAEKFPERAFNFGVAEQNMMAAAAGLASCGKIPFVSTYAVFATMRACEQMRTFVAYPNMPVKVVATHGGISVGWDGVTHQGTEDVGIVRSIPNFSIVCPADAVATERVIEDCLQNDGPQYVRLARNPVPVIYDKSYRFELGRASVLRDGDDVTLFAAGVMVHEALVAADMLAKEGVSARVADMATIKPIDADAVERAACQTGAIVTAEDHNVHGGLGSAVAEAAGERCPCPLIRVGLPDCFGESGDPEELFDKYGLSARHIADAARRAIAMKKGCP